MNGIFAIYESDGNGRRTPKEKVKIEQNKHLFGLPPPSMKWWPTVFRSPRGLRTSLAEKGK